MTVDIASLVSDNLDVWTTAVERKSGVGRGGKRVDLYGLNQLRSLILALAVNGKLVGGNVSVKHGVLDDVGDWISGNAFPKGFQGSSTGDVPFLKVSDMNLPGNEREITVFNNSVSPAALKSMRARAHPAGTIIFPKIGGAIATNKRRILSKPSAIDNNCAGQIPRMGINPDWLFMVLTSIDMSAYQAGTSVPALNMKRLAQHAIAIPDEKGQTRIIEKVDELMALCDTLERESAAAMAAHQELVEALLATLTTCTDAVDLATNWARLEAHFDTLFTTEASVDALKQTVLELAVSGRLVPNSASAKQGTLDDVGVWVGGNGFPKQYQGNATGEVPFLKVSDMNLPGNEREITVANNWVSREALKSMKARAHPAGTIIFPKIGGAIATNKRRILSVSAAIDNNCAGQVPAKGINIDWLFMVLSSIDMAQYQAGTSVPALNMRRLAKHAIAIPDEAAQKVIVARVHDMMSLCDMLIERLAGSVETQRHLADTIVELAVA